MEDRKFKKENELETDENVILRERVKKLRHIALEIKKEAEDQVRIMDDARSNFSSTVVKINNTINSLKDLIEDKFSISIYLIISTVVILFVICIFFKFI